MENYKFFFKGVKIDDRTEEYIIKRLDIIGKMLKKILQVEVEIEFVKKSLPAGRQGKFRVEVMIKTPYELYRAEETTESIEGSVDIVENELKIQIKKDKGRRKTLVKRGGLSIKKKITLDESARF